MAEAPFRVRVPREVENRLERVPLDVAVRFEAHLSAADQVAATNWSRSRSHADELERLRRFDCGGFTIEFLIDCMKQVVLVRGLYRNPIGPAVDAGDVSVTGGL